MFDSLGRLVLRARLPIVLAWLALAGAAVILLPPLSSLTSSEEAGFLPLASPSRVATERIAAAFPAERTSSSATVVFDRAGTTLTAADREAIAALGAWLRGPDVPSGLAERIVLVEGAADAPGFESMYRSADGAVELLSVRLAAHAFTDRSRLAVDALREALASRPLPAGVRTSVTGTAAISRDYLAAVVEGTDRTTVVTIVLVVAILLLIYRAPLAAAIPLVTIGAAFLVARGVLSLLAQAGWDIPSLLDTFIVVLVFGVGTDYAIFLLSRYREERASRVEADAAAVTISRIGAVITASAATVVVGLCSMAIASFGLIQRIGPALAITVVVTLAAGLTLTPALAAIAGRWLYWPRHIGAGRGVSQPPSRWERLAEVVTRHPRRVSVAVIAALVVPILALPWLRVEFDALAELPRGTPSRRGFDVVASHFDRGQLLPLSILLEAREGVDLGSPGGLALVASTADRLRTLEGVRAVRTLVSPSGDGSVPDGLRPSRRLALMSDAMRAGSDPVAALTSLGDPATLVALDGALAYLDALAAAYPDLAAAGPMATLTDDARALRTAVADHQAPRADAATRGAALGTLLALAPRLPGELSALAERFEGRPDDLFLPRSLATADPATVRLLATYLSDDGRAARLSVVTSEAPYSGEAFATVHRVRAGLADLVGETDGADRGVSVARASVGGPTAESADVQATIGEDFRLVGLITTLGILVVLALLLRSLVAPVYLVATVLLSFATTLGLSVILFQGVLGHQGVDYFIPLIVFVLLVALGSDYNIFLMSRVREESVGRDLDDGIRIATARTGTVITSAGVILAGTFLALAVAPLQILQQVGLAVGIGVLIDTFVVRSLLIPALTAWIGPRAWWPSSVGGGGTRPALAEGAEPASR